MTKEELREYQSIKKELLYLERLYKQIARTGDEKLKARYEELSATLNKELETIEGAIATLNPTERTLMRLRYIEGLSWQAVCLSINYEWRHTHRIHARALQKLKNL